MATTTEQQTTTLQITAAELQPGDVVLDEHGDRDHAAFDVDVRDGAVTIWPALPDREMGWPRQYTVPAATAYTVARRAR